MLFTLNDLVLKIYIQKKMKTKIKEDLELLVRDIMSLSMSGVCQAIYLEQGASAWCFDDIITFMIEKANELLKHNDITGKLEAIYTQAQRTAFEAGRARIDHPDWDYIYETFEDYLKSKQDGN